MELGVGRRGSAAPRARLKALGGLYDHLGFGPFLRRQGERLAQMSAG